MDPTANPFAPGAGSRPPELAGRDQIITNATIALGRVRAGRHAKSQMLLGLRGVGKTVLLNRIEEIAENEGYLPVVLEAPENRRLAEMLVPELRKVLTKLSRVDHARDLANSGLGALRAFAAVFKVKVGEFEVGLQPEEGTADTGDLEIDLPDLLMVVARAAAKADKPVVILVDEVQYLTRDELGALIVSVHKIGQRTLPLVVFGAGLPQLAALAGEAKSYAERLFDFPPVGPLDPAAATKAVREPVLGEGATIAAAALSEIVRCTEGYPYFLQEWGSHSWNIASKSPITKADVKRATELGAGPHRSGDIASELGVDVRTVGPLRSGLIRKGMIYSPSHGDTAFTVPMFDAFMRRTIPDWTSRAARKSWPAECP